MWRSGGMMTVLGAVLGLREVGARLGELAGQAASFAGGPTPRSVDWIAGTARAQRILAAADNGLALAAGVLAVALAWRLLRLLNPSGTLVSAARGGETPIPRLQTPLEPALLWRSFAGALATAYLFGLIPLAWLTMVGASPPPIFWGLTGLTFLGPGRPWLGLATAFLLGGAAVWLIWGEWGAVAPPRGRATSWAGTVARGLLAGAAAFPVLLPLLPWGRGLMDGVLTAVGLSDAEAWRRYLCGMGLGLPLAFGALGLIGHALARPERTPARLLPLPVLGLALLAAGEGWFEQAVAVGRYDYGRELAQLVGAARGPSSARTYVIFPPSPAPGPLPGFVPYMSIQRVDAGHDSPRLTWEYLRRRQYHSAAAYDAFVHLHDCASLRWDSAESLRVDLADLEHNPQPVFAGLLLEKLSTCATSPENHALLREASDSRRLRPDPAWLHNLGLLHLRFGERTEAARLLRQAGLAPAELERALGREAPLTTGLVTGRILVNGRTAAGLMVGLLPGRRWETLVGTPRPFEHRWVVAAARTDAGGRFRLRDLGEGSYVLIVMGDPLQLPLRESGARADASPGLIELSAHHPAPDLGTIRIFTQGGGRRPMPKTET